MIQLRSHPTAASTAPDWIERPLALYENPRVAGTNGSDRTPDLRSPASIKGIGGATAHLLSEWWRPPDPPAPLARLRLRDARLVCSAGGQGAVRRDATATVVRSRVPAPARG